jgi:Skp family chaperone for outer membrane proteins
VLDVTKSLSVAAVFGAVLLVCDLALPGWSQQRAAARPAAAPTIAMIDVGRVFKEYARFNQQVEALKGEAQTAEQAFKEDTKFIQGKIDELKGLKAGSLEYSNLEQEIARMRSDLNVRVQLKRKEFVQREGKAYHVAYAEVSELVRYFAQRNGISVVLRYNGEKVDAENPEDVIRDLNKPVLYFADGLDITAHILQGLNNGQGTRAADQRGAAAPGPRAGVPAQPPR